MKKSINNFVIPIGDTKIAASMNRANHNRGEAQIFVVPVADLEFLKDQVVEVQTGSDLHLPISMIPHLQILQDTSLEQTDQYCHSHLKVIMYFVSNSSDDERLLTWLGKVLLEA